MLATDARAASLRRVAVSGVLPLTREVAEAASLASFGKLSKAEQQGVYRALWRDLGLHRIQVRPAHAIALPAHFRCKT